MKAAWVAIISAVLGAVVGAIVVVVVQTHYQELLHGPPEGVFAVDVSSIGESEVDPLLRNQIKEYPVFVKVTHIDGPPAEGVSIKLEGKRNLEDLRVQRQDDSAQAEISPDKKRLTIQIPRLRKGSAIHYKLASLGDPDISKSVQIAKGRLLEEKQDGASSRWYKGAIIIGVTAVGLIAAGLGAAVILVGRVFGKEDSELLRDRQFVLVVIFALALSALPVVGGLAIVVPLACVYFLYQRILLLEAPHKEKSVGGESDPVKSQ